MLRRTRRLLGYVWASPVTAIGLVLATLALARGRLRLVDGVLEAHGPALGWVLRRCAPLPGGAAAMALGHVVIARDQQALDVTRAHERVHVRQCEGWGPLFPCAYVAASAWAALCGGDYYADNAFEREAGLRTTSV